MEKVFKTNDIVWVTARHPMPQDMEKKLFRPQKIKIAAHPYYEFENGWSVDVNGGDKLFLKIKSYSD